MHKYDQLKPYLSVSSCDIYDLSDETISVPKLIIKATNQLRTGVSTGSAKAEKSPKLKALGYDIRSLLLLFLVG